MPVIIWLGVLALLSGCASAPKQTDALLKDHSDLPSRSLVGEVPFIQQKKNHCGPATMAMVLEHAGKSPSLSELTSQMFTPGMQGTFQSEMLSAARRQGMIAIPVNDMRSLIQELSAQNPVIIFQNLGLSFSPQWHYALALGHDFRGPDIILHSGEKKFLRTNMRVFEHTWKLAGHWGLLVLRPDQLAASANDLTHTKAAAALEQAGNLTAAETAYLTILKRWPLSQGALIGMGNIAHAAQDFKTAEKYLTTAAQYHPQSSVVWHNLAVVQGALGQRAAARESSLKAIAQADEGLREKFQISLKEWLDSDRR